LFQKKSLQVASFTITEKGYALRGLDGEFFPVVRDDVEKGPSSPRHAMSVAAALAYARYEAGEMPIAFLSLDNCSRNGERLRDAILTIAREWASRGLVRQGFTEYLEEGKKVSFPWSMIDKITPYPSESVKKKLNDLGREGMDIVVTGAKTVIAPFVNAEAKEYLAIEDDFPAGRMKLSAPGVYFTDRETVEKTEKMKVSTCLNPIHTALAIFGCMLGYSSIWEETRDDDLRHLIRRLAFTEGMPVVADPGVIDPVVFAREVIEERLPNPNIPDTPQRIATDTSQKIGIRFGETLRAYRERAYLDAKRLTYIPLVIAAWFRYLLAVNDEGEEMPQSPDPMLPALRESLSAVEFGKPETYAGQLLPILRNEAMFHVNIEEMGLAGRIEEMFVKMIAGPGSVRKTLKEYIAREEK
jgi:fructuronate reductase